MKRMQTERQHIIVKIECADREGIVSVVSGTICELGGNITSLREHVESSEIQKQAGKFFARIECVIPIECERIAKILRDKIKAARVTVHPLYKKDIIVFATREYHCLGDLLLRNMYGDINACVRAVVSNHDILRSLCESFHIPFFFVPCEKNMKREQHEEIIQEQIQNISFEYIVLARYMRILSKRFVDRYPSRIINIHHSFLPAFIGANPYRQAYERGVKIIGATAHFVSEDLDEGPIIDQQVLDIDHSYDIERLKNAGRDGERRALARALELVCDDRVFICGNKTIIL